MFGDSELRLSRLLAAKNVADGFDRTKYTEGELAAYEAGLEEINARASGERAEAAARLLG